MKQRLEGKTTLAMPSNKSRVIKDKRRETAEGILLLHLFGSSLPGLLFMNPAHQATTACFLPYLKKVFFSRDFFIIPFAVLQRNKKFFVLAQFLSQQGEAKKVVEANLSGINDFLLGAKAHQALRYWCCANENTKISLHSFTSFKCWYLLKP